MSAAHGRSRVQRVNVIRSRGVLALEAELACVRRFKLSLNVGPLEFSSNTGTFFRTRLRKRNPRAVYLCSETVSPSDAWANSSPIVTSRFAESCDASSATTGAEAPRSLIPHESLQDSDQGGGTP